MNVKMRRIKLYNLLSTYEGRWFTQEEICEFIPEYKFNPNPKHTADKCPAILGDKNAINGDSNFPLIITCKNYRFKVASESEYEEEIKSHIKRLLKQKKLIDDMDFKFGKHRTFDLFGNCFIKSVVEKK